MLMPDGMESEKQFAYRISAIVSLGFALAIVGATYVDARIPSHVRYGARVYRYGYWLALLAIPVFVITAIGLVKTKTRGRRWAWASLPMCCAVRGSLWAFAPEIPHQGIVGTCLMYVVVALITTWLHNSKPEIQFIRDQSIPLQVRLEGLKSAITMWQGIAIATCAGFLAGVIPWSVAVINANSHTVTADRDVFLLNGLAVIQVGLISVTLIVGPIREAVNSVMVLTARFPEITVDCNPSSQERLTDE